MDGDPWFWTVQQVSDFFSHQAHSYVHDFPNSRLPDLPLFLQALTSNDVSGAVLLTAVDPSFLRADCGISSLGVRSTILHCLSKLRARSTVYEGNIRGSTSAGNGQQQDVTSNPLISGQNIRNGERQVEDVHGRKRRKLDLSHTIPQQTRPKITGIPKLMPEGYLGDSALPIDEVFFGSTLLGHQIGNLQPDGVVSDSEDTFQFQVQHKACGERDYIWSQMRHFLCNEGYIETQRSGRSVSAILPYQDRLVVKDKPRSAIVFRVNDSDGTVSVVRENAAFLNTDYDYNIPVQTFPSASGEWDFLLAKHKGLDELPIYQGSLEITSSLANELEAEEEERAREAQGHLTVAQVAEIMDETIRTFVIEWKQRKLPRLEEKQAWRVWKQTKHSKTLRDILIEDATANILSLEQRLSRYMAKFRSDEWHSDRDLRLTCEIMRVTIEDREEFLWKKNVWTRREEPNHQRGNRKGSAANRRVARLSCPGFIVRPDDRLITSRDTATIADVDIVGDTAEIHALDHAPSDLEASLIANPDNGIDSHDVMGMDLDVPERLCSSSESVESFISRNDNVPSSPPVLDHKSSSKAMSIHEPRNNVSDSEGLPDISSLSPGRPKLKLKLMSRTPAQPSPGYGLETEPIDLTTLSSDSSSPLKKFPFNRPRAQADYSSNPYETSLAQVKLWDQHELAKRGDRLRLLIKLLQMAGPDDRDILSSCYRELRRGPFLDALKDTLRGTKHNAGRLESLDPFSTLVTDPKQRAAMKRLADIAMAWLLCDPDVIRRPLTMSEWATASEQETQFDNFVDQAATILRKKDSKLFQRPKNSSTTPIVSISDDDFEAVSKNLTPHRTRKKPVKISKAAKEVRTQALQRLEKFKSAIESQPSDSQQLAAMLEAGSSKSEIVINPTMKHGQEPIYIHSNIARKIKAHQIDGVRFMWREITDDSEQGCILAHTMGLGKTMQTIAVLIAVNEAALSRDSNIRKQLPARLRPRGIYEKRQLRILILSPPTLLPNWHREIEEWAGQALGNVFIIESALSNQKRMDELESWNRLGGILLISYNLFQSYFQNHIKPEERQKADQILLQNTELVVADEVHNLKNKDSKMAKAASMLQTQSRIGLTGTPMSNNLQEIYSLISFVAPGYLGEPNEFMGRFTEPIKQGTYVESTPHEVRTSRKKLEVLRLEIEPKVNRANITVLRGSLKPKIEFVITIPLTSTQQSIFNSVIDVLTEGANRPSDANRMTIFGWLAMLTVLTNHPMAFKRKLLTPSQSRTKQSKRSKRAGVSEDESAADAGNSAIVQINDIGDAAITPVETEEDFRADTVFSEEVITTLTASIPDDADPKLSAKASIFFDIMDLSRKCGDKVLAFSSSIATLEYLTGVLDTSNIPFVRIDGKVPTGKRLALVEEFNTSAASVMLISTKAGGTGLNIQAANRVVIFDFGFNPSWEEQAIGRVYRLGQTKPVYVYRFVTGGTFEDQIYDKQLFKQALTLRVVDKQNPRRNVTRNMHELVYKPREVEQQKLDEWTGKDPNVLDQIVLRYGQNQPLIRALRTMETLQEDAGDMPLTEEDWREIIEDRGVMASSRNKGRSTVQAASGGLSTTSTTLTTSTPPASGPASVPASAHGSGTTPFPHVSL